MDRIEYEKIYALEESYWWYRGLHDLARGAIEQYSPGFLSLLDAGCGTGGLLRRLREWRPRARYVGCDRSPHAIDLCRRRGLSDLARSSIDAIALRSAAFDVVTCLDVLYFEGIDVAGAFREIARVLRPGGLLVLNLPAFELLRSSHDRFVRGARRFSRPEVVEQVTRAGFDVVRASYWNATLFPLITVLRLTRRRRSVAESDLRPMAPLWNRALYGIVRLEARWLRRHRLPVGTSIFCVARKGDVSHLSNLEIVGFSADAKLDK